MMTDRVGQRIERELTFADGDQIIAAGDRGEDMFVVLEGCVRISRSDGAVATVLGEIGRGGFFGEMSLLESLPRDADAHAVGPTRLLAIGQGGLLVRIRRDPTFALELLHQLSATIRRANERLVVDDADR